MPALLPPRAQGATIVACHAVEEERDPAPAGADQRMGTTATAL
jgi:hypothetical protein